MNGRVLIGRIASAVSRPVSYLCSESLGASELGIAYAWARRIAPSAIKILEKEDMSKII